MPTEDATANVFSVSGGGTTASVGRCDPYFVSEYGRRLIFDEAARHYEAYTTARLHGERPPGRVNCGGENVLPAAAVHAARA
jgi:hypothetical protein